MRHYFISGVKPRVAAASPIGGTFQPVEQNAGIGNLFDIQVIKRNVDMGDGVALCSSLIWVRPRRQETRMLSLRTGRICSDGSCSGSWNRWTIGPTVSDWPRNRAHARVMNS